MRLRDVRPIKLRTQIKEFLSWHDRLSEKFYAEGRCWEMTKEFIDHLWHIKFEGDIRAVKADRLPEYKKYYDSHWVVWIDGLHIDFTARQFHHAFSHPRLWRGGHGCELKKMSAKRKDKIGIDANINAWEYV